jgi:DNA polymerase III alpha subunit
VEQKGSREKTMQYKPKNEVELSALIAGIRPSFASLIKTLINREKFDYNIPVLDNLIQTPEMPYTFILYQEQLMQILGFAGFPMKDTYDIVKSVSKKKTYCRECGAIGNASMQTCPHCASTNIAPLVDKYKEQFMQGLKKEIGNVANYEETADEIWHIVLAFAGYGFNSSHSYCMALDSLNQAYLKAHYPLEFYETMLRRYTDKGNKDKVKALKEEMKYFDIKLGEMKFGEDNRNFTLNKENNSISQSLVSIKGVSQIVADEIYRIANLRKYDGFIDILNEIKNNSKIKSDQLNSLIEIGYFSEYGCISYLKKATELYNKYFKAKIIKKDGTNDSVIEKFAKKSTEKQFKEIDTIGLINFFLGMEENETSTVEEIIIEHKIYGESDITNETYDPRWCIALEIDTTYSPKITFYNIYSGRTQTLKINKKMWKKESFNLYDVVCLNETQQKPKKFLNKQTEKWEATGEYEWWINDYWKVEIIN